MVPLSTNSRAELGRLCVPKPAKKCVDYFIQIARVKLRRIFGYDLIQLVDPKGNKKSAKYALMHKSRSVASLSKRRTALTIGAQEEVGKLMFVLGAIHFNNEKLKEKTLLGYLSEVDIPNEEAKRLLKRFERDM